jgi:methylmalonyl-CoA mutase cobalamin-binding subunit
MDSSKLPGTIPQHDRRPLKFLVSTVPSDSHVWNLVVLQLVLEEMDHEVVNLGACVPVELLLRACRDERPDCVVISTINGHGHVDGAQIITALRADPELSGLTVVIGGKLGVEGDADAALRDELLQHGFDEVFQVAAGDTGEAIASFREFVAARVGCPV